MECHIHVHSELSVADNMENVEISKRIFQETHILQYSTQFISPVMAPVAPLVSLLPQSKETPVSHQ